MLPVSSSSMHILQAMVEYMIKQKSLVNTPNTEYWVIGLHGKLMSNIDMHKDVEEVQDDHLSKNTEEHVHECIELKSKFEALFAKLKMLTIVLGRKSDKV